MLRAAIVFFILAIISMVLGAGNIAGISMEIGKTLLFVFLVLAILSGIVGLINGRGGPKNLT